MNRLSHYVSLFRFAAVLAGALVLIGCDGTEGGNPNRLDGGPMGGSCGDVGDAGPAGDAGAAMPPVPTCDPDGAGAAACDCAAGPNATLESLARTVIFDVSLHGPTPSGGAVAVVARPCFGGLCGGDPATLRIHRLDAEGRAMGTPIEVPADLENRPSAALDGATLALIWTDAVGPDMPGNPMFAALDVESGAWTIARRGIVVDGSESPAPIAISRGASGWATAWSGEPNASHHVAIAADGTPGATVRLPIEFLELAPHPAGQALITTDAGSIVFRTLAADGTLSAPVSTPVDAGAITAVAPRAAGGYHAAYTSLTGTRIAHLDASGAIVAPAWELGPLGVVSSVVPAPDGTTWVLWARENRCAGDPTPISTDLLLAHFGAGGTRIADDVRVSDDSSVAAAAAAVLTARGPIVAHAHTDDTSGVDARAVCLPD